MPNPPGLGGGHFTGDPNYQSLDQYTIYYPDAGLQPGDIARIDDTTTGQTYNLQYVGNGSPAYNGSDGQPVFYDRSDAHGDAHYFIADAGYYLGGNHIPSLELGLFEGGTPVYPVPFPVCYVAGTAILTPTGEIPVETLRPGDMVVTQNGHHRPIRWIGRRGYPANLVNTRPSLQPIRFKANALAPGIPHRDLLVSPAHAILIDSVLIPAEVLVNGKSIFREADFDNVHYIHIELEEHDVIWAEGVPCETYLDLGNRTQFETGWPCRDSNLAGEKAAVSCKRWLDNGPIVDRVRKRLSVRASAGTPPENLRGGIDQLDGGRLRGWAQNCHRPEVPVCLDILVDGECVSQSLANRFRSDLKAQGLGSGRHAFELPLKYKSGASMLEVRRSSDSALVDARAL